MQDDQPYISTAMETCSDVSSCPPLLRYRAGCCEKCKIETLSKHDCLPETLAESLTVAMIRVQIPPHGICKNNEAVRGITQCSGVCKSGTKFDPGNFGFSTDFLPLFLSCFIFSPGRRRNAQKKFFNFHIFSPLFLIRSDFTSIKRLQLLFGKRSEGNARRACLRR